ncbi:MAG TPA: YciI family protein [Beijerinckiaceae bacterium]|nr:YciI family protein [Beijerinckiaceae bacterium]
MYVVEFHNLKPNDEVDENLDEHRAFLAKHAATGVIIAAGPKIPRTGGMMIIDNISRAQLDELLSQDPFLKRGSARCEVIEFKSNFRCPGLDHS